MTDLPGAVLFDIPLIYLGAGLPLADYESAALYRESLSGSFSENRPRPTLPRAYIGAVLRSYADDYYNRIWVVPPLAELGSVSITVQFNVKLWNAHLTPVTITGWNETGQMSNTSLSPSHAHPRFIPALGVEAYTLIAQGDGDAILNGRETWTTSIGEEPFLLVTGQRAVLWTTTLWPNWDRSPVVVKYEYLTEIITSRSGLEQRIRKRALPRKTVEFEARSLDSIGLRRHREFRRTLAAQQNKTFVVPEWTRRTCLTQPVALNSKEVHLGSVPPWLYAGRQIVLSNGVGIDLLTIESADAEKITLTSYTSATWGLDAYVMPALSCYMPDKITGTMHLPQATTHQITFTQFPTTEKDAAFDEGAPILTLDGREVFPFRINWRVDVSLEEMWPVETVMYESGPVERFRVIDFPSRVSKFSVMVKSQDEGEELRRFFMRMKGRHHEFWFPSEEDDFELKEPSPAGLNTVRVEGLTLLELHELTNRSVRGVVFRQLDGTRIHAKIASMAVRNDNSGVDTLIQLYDALPANVGPGYTKFISFMYLARFAIDSLAIAYETPGVGQAEVSVQSLPYKETE